MHRNVILCVDDEPQVLESLRRDLEDHYGQGRILVETFETAAEVGVRITDILNPEDRVRSLR